jgi:ATP-dependent DNA helicase RecG
MTESDLIKILSDLRGLPAETEVVEFKEAKANYDFSKLGKYFSALCNEANLKGKSCAWLVFGVEDKRKAIVGSAFRHKRSDLDSLKHEIAEKTTNRITFIEIYELNISDGRVVMFQIPAAPKGIPITFEGHYYGRDHENLGPLNLEEIERIRRQSNIHDWSAEIVPESSLADLDEEAIVVARTNFKKKFPALSSEVDSWDSGTFLNKAKITIQGKITKASLLLLGKSGSEHFILPAHSKMTWILKDKNNSELDYAHFSAPFILSVTLLFNKIRNLKYRYIKDDSLFPEEVDMYDLYVIREALHNCIAHQDYLMGGKILVVEFPDKLIFVNNGSFIPGTVEHAIERDAPDTQSRNPFLATAMFNLNMIDTIGSGIKKMYTKQSERFFPLPDYTIGPDKVSVEIVGKVLELDYARILATRHDLSLHEIILLDKIQKHKFLTNDEAAQLKERNLIEGRKPNYHISMGLAKDIGKKADYIKSRGFKDEHYKKMILEYLGKYKQAGKQDIDKLILDILPAVLDPKQRANKVHNLLFAMSRKDNTIKNVGNNRKPVWIKNS